MQLVLTNSLPTRRSSDLRQYSAIPFRHLAVRADAAGESKCELRDLPDHPRQEVVRIALPVDRAAVDACGGMVVDVAAVSEDLQLVLLAGEPGDDARFDRSKVGHDELVARRGRDERPQAPRRDRKSTRLNSSH